MICQHSQAIHVIAMNSANRKVYRNQEGIHFRIRASRNGTYVQPHYSTKPNQTKTDNYSSKGNMNPYTGEKGTKDPYKNPYKTK